MLRGMIAQGLGFEWEKMVEDDIVAGEHVHCGT